MRIGEDAMPEEINAIRLVKRAGADGVKFAHPIILHAVAKPIASQRHAMPIVAAGGTRFNMAEGNAGTNDE